MRLAAHGIRARLPAGWEGSITTAQPDAVAQARSSARSAPLPGGGADHPLPVTHVSTFGLPGLRGDFGAEAVAEMGRDDVFVALLEYAPEEADSALFAHRGLPRRLDPRAFSPWNLQRMVRGQAGLQLFFNEAGRAFCLYVVIGDADDARRLARKAEAVLATIEIEEHA